MVSLAPFAPGGLSKYACNPVSHTVTRAMLLINLPTTSPRAGKTPSYNQVAQHSFIWPIVSMWATKGPSRVKGLGFRIYTQEPSKVDVEVPLVVLLVPYIFPSRNASPSFIVLDIVAAGNTRILNIGTPPKLYTQYITKL